MWVVEQAALRAPISFELLMQDWDLSNFKGQRQDSEDCGQGPWGRRRQRGLRGDFGVWRRGGERASAMPRES